MKKDDVIIPVGIQSQYKFYKKYYKENIYEMLDDKFRFYKYLDKNPELLNGINIKKIPTYDKFYNGPDMNNNFVVKNKNEAGSRENFIIKDNIYNLIEKYGEQYQIQEVINVKYVHAIRCACKNGEIYSIFTGLVKNGISTDNYKKGYSSNYKTYIENEDIKTFIYKFIKNINYNGFIEVEFLIDHNNNIYIMEVNPRICGLITSYEYFKNMILPFIEKSKNPEYINNIREEGITHMPPIIKYTTENILSFLCKDILYLPIL